MWSKITRFNGAPYLVYRLLTASLQSTRNFSITLIVSGLEKSVSSPKACEKFGDECTESHVLVGKKNLFVMIFLHILNVGKIW